MYHDYVIIFVFLLAVENGANENMLCFLVLFIHPVSRKN
jgi:hypothetical protein